MSKWSEYVKLVVRDEPQAVVRERLGMSQSTASRWMSGTYSPSDAATIAHFARTYGRNPLEAFVVAGVLEMDQVLPALNDDAVHLLAELGFQGPPDPPAHRTA